MTSTNGPAGIAGWLHRHLLPLIVASYALAAVAPGAGLWLKEARVLDFEVGGGRFAPTLPKLMLSVLLFAAGMRVRPGRIGAIARRPGVVLAGLAANLALPALLLGAMVPMLGAWHNPDEAAIVLVGLALVSAMPIAGSSTGWAQAADGDMAISLGLVLGSTLLSPVTTPALLHGLGAIAPGRHGLELHRLAGRGTGSFLVAWVLAPSLLGILARRALGEARAEAVDRRFRIVAPATLLLLCYSNASACLPDVIRKPDWDFFAIILTFVVGLCALTFAGGFALGRVLKVDRSERASLVFGLGMNNNGTGLVLASAAVGTQPMMLLPIIAYNLTQHLAAGAADVLLRRSGRD